MYKTPYQCQTRSKKERTVSYNCIRDVSFGGEMVNE
jgi:hypothetical protein